MKSLTTLVQESISPPSQIVSTAQATYMLATLTMQSRVQILAQEYLRGVGVDPHGLEIVVELNNPHWMVWVNYYGQRDFAKLHLNVSWMATGLGDWKAMPHTITLSQFPRIHWRVDGQTNKQFISFREALAHLGRTCGLPITPPSDEAIAQAHANNPLSTPTALAHILNCPVYIVEQWESDNVSWDDDGDDEGDEGIVEWEL